MYDLKTHCEAQRLYHDNPAVTLDGREAVIAGWRNDYPTVCTLDGKQRVEYARETIARVVTTGDGKFLS